MCCMQPQLSVGCCRFFHKPVSNTVDKVWRRRGWFGIVLVVLLFGGWNGARVLAGALDRQDHRATVAIVLGAAAWNGRPSPVLRERVRHAVQLYQSGAVQHLLFTGGVARNDRWSEAQVAADYALVRGVPRAAALVETRSRSTQENLCFALPLLQERQWRDVLIVSDPFHVHRGVVIAQKLGLAATGSPTRTSRFTSLRSQSQFWLRETWLMMQLHLRYGFGGREALCDGAGD